jgi:hypothetical protein
MYVGVHAEYRYYCQILMKLGRSRQFVEKILQYQIS